MSTPEILPGATLGVLGSGQLGRMFAMSARRLGYGVHVYSPDSNTPAGQLADREWCGAYDDLDQLMQFARQVHVVTLEFENIPGETLRALEKVVPVRPGPAVLEASQNRLREKTQLRSFGLPTADFVQIQTVQELQQSLEQFGGRGILKTASWGYDGKGQRLVESSDDLNEAWADFDGQETIFESFVDYAIELSVIAVRHPDGDVVCYEPIINQHRNHILDVSTTASRLISASIASQAKEIATTVMESLEVVGVLCVEMFLTNDGRLLINEIAPRPHNSGHLTIDAHATSQFEQQVRSICALPLGSTALRQPAAMTNLLGDLWPENGVPRWSAVLKRPGVKLHLYGKTEARPGRKMGHLTCLAEDARIAEAAARMARDDLRPSE